jgi:hypothetical protein
MRPLTATAANKTFGQSADHALEQAAYAVELKINAVRAANADRLEHDRLAITFAKEIEATGSVLVEAMREPYSNALQHEVDKGLLRSKAMSVLTAYLTKARRWGRVPPGFSQGRNRTLDSELDKIETRLTSAMQEVFRAVDLTPPKRWHERHPIIWTLGSMVFGGLLTFLVQAAVRTLFP